MNVHAAARGRRFSRRYTPWLRSIPCLTQADLYKRNYFAPGSLRMPDSPLVRKYLAMSNDVHMLEAISGENVSMSEMCTVALANAVSAGALGSCSDQLLREPPRGDSGASVAVATFAKEGGSASSRTVAQAQASKEVLVQQLIELSDQLAQARISRARGTAPITASASAR